MPDPAAAPPAERLAYSVEEAAQITGLSRDLLYDQMRTGRLAYLKVGRRRIITRQHLEAFLTQGVTRTARARRGRRGLSTTRTPPPGAGRHRWHAAPTGHQEEGHEANHHGRGSSAPG